MATGTTRERTYISEGRPHGKVGCCWRDDHFSTSRSTATSADAADASGGDGALELAVRADAL